jgi:hypothetical protein
MSASKSWFLNQGDRDNRGAADTHEQEAITETKRLVDIASLPPDSEIAPEWEAFMKSLARPATQERLKKLMAQGFHRPGDVENRLGEYVGQLGL